MSVQTAGILVYRRLEGKLEVLLAHPGGPFWAKKDSGAWSIPKGIMEPGENLQAAARREFAEETGFSLEGDLLSLGSLRQQGGKELHVFAIEADIDAAGATSNTFTMEWPPKSGRMEEFPEIDRVAWFPLAAARDKILQGQRPFLERLEEILPPDRDY